jgi:hypothetical protein
MKMILTHEQRDIVIFADMNATTDKEFIQIIERRLGDKIEAYGQCFSAEQFARRVLERISDHAEEFFFGYRNEEDKMCHHEPKGS